MSKVCVLIVVMLSISCVLLAQDDTTPIPHQQTVERIGDSIVYPPNYDPVSMSIMTMGDKIRYYCISNLVSVEGFAAMCTDMIREQYPLKNIPGRPLKISADLIWEIIREEKEPIGELRIVILQILDEKPKEPKESEKQRKTKIDF